MRIHSVQAIDSQTNEKRIFTFGQAGGGNHVVTSGGGRLNSYLEFCFTDGGSASEDVTVVFSVNDDKFSLRKSRGEDGVVRSFLKKETDGKWQIVARNKNAVPFIEQLIKEQMSDILRSDYVSVKAVEEFHGDLNLFEEIRLLLEVEESVSRSAAEARKRSEQALNTVRQFGEASVNLVTRSQVEEVSAQLDDNYRKVTALTAELNELKIRHAEGAIKSDILAELDSAQKQYNLLAEKKQDIEEQRAKLALRDEVAALVPKVAALQSIAEQRADYEKKRYALVSELEWQENELAGVSAQLEEKQRQAADIADKRSRIEAINGELTYIAGLYEKNKTLNEQLLELNEQQERLNAERVLYKNKMDSIEKSINEVKQNLDAFHIPNKSVGELLETVRVDVKIDEVTAQIEKLQSEIAVKESKIAEKESNLVMQVKRFKSVAELDVTVAPIKAKDTILQVLDSKYAKLETVNVSLREKQRNLERASEDYKYRILQLEHSKSRLEAELEKVRLKKQEEFKREVFLNSQKVYSDDASGVFAVTANLNDEEVATLRQELINRNIDRDVLLERASELDGALKEIKRQIEINSAEMETLLQEKNNINKRYNEIVTQNKNEAVFNYLKALDSNNGTRYLLDVQQDAVRSEAELADLKSGVEALKLKLSGLHSRLRYLKDTQKQLDSSQSSVDTLVSTNDRLKDELTDMGQRLSAAYEQYRAVSQQMETTDRKLEGIKAAVVETTKSVKVNETQIAAATEKAKKYAGSEDLEQALTTFKYEIADIESERQMLADSKHTVEKEVFRKRLELEKLQWLYDSKTREYDELYEKLQFEFNLKGLSVEQINSVDFKTDTESVRAVIKEYDAARSALAEKIENYYALLKARPDDAEINAAQAIAEKEKNLQALLARQEELEFCRKENLSRYVAASSVRVRAAAAAAQAETLSSLKDSIAHNEIVGLLIRDKIKTVLATANGYLRAFTGKEMTLEADGSRLAVKTPAGSCLYDNLEKEDKIAVYLGMILAAPNTDVSEGRWLVFEDDDYMDARLLDGMLGKLENVSCVVGYSEEN